MTQARAWLRPEPGPPDHGHGLAHAPEKSPPSSAQRTPDGTMRMTNYFDLKKSAVAFVGSDGIRLGSC